MGDRVGGQMSHAASQELVITAVGPDRPGIASDFTGHVHAAGANLADTRMANLRGQFAFVALVEGSAEALERVKQRLQEAAPSIGLRIDFSSPASKDGAGPREGVP